jgi:hypothetical protein
VQYLALLLRGKLDIAAFSMAFSLSVYVEFEPWRAEMLMSATTNQ